MQGGGHAGRGRGQIEGPGGTHFIGGGQYLGPHGPSAYDDAAVSNPKIDGINAYNKLHTILFITSSNKPIHGASARSSVSKARHRLRARAQKTT